MSGREVMHRAGRFLSLEIEKKRIDNGWEPKISTEVVGKHFLFPKDAHIVNNWKKRFNQKPEQLNRLIRGRVDFFGHEPVDIGDPVQWHRDPSTGLVAPSSKVGKTLNYRDDSLVGNVKFLWELGRHQHLLPLAVMYAVNGTDIYRRSVVSQIDDWIMQNDFGKGIHWCSALEVSLRLISWSVIHSLFYLRDNGNGLFDLTSDKVSLGKSIYQHAWFIAHFLSRYSSANNHLIGELTGLLTGCQVFNLGREGEAWAAIAQRELEQEAVKQVFVDGVNKEQAIYYHLWVLEYFLFASLVGERSDEAFSPRFTRTVDSMADYLQAVTPKGGVPPQIGDADDGFVTRFEASWPKTPFEDVLSAVSICRSKQPYQKMSQKAYWYGVMAGVNFQGSTCSGRHENKPGYPRIFPLGGYAVLGDELLHLVFDAGPLGYPSIAAHGHADALNFCLAINGSWWIIDPGTYSYHSQPEWRNYFRGTSAHNTIEVDSMDQSQIGGPFLWTKHAPTVFESWSDSNKKVQWAQGFHRGYKGVKHTRKILLNPDSKEIRLIDDIDGGGQHNLAMNFHFTPQASVTCIAPGKWKVTMGNCIESLVIIGDEGWAWQVFQGEVKPICGWYSSALSNKIPTNTLTAKWSGALPARVTTYLRVEYGQCGN